MGPLHEFIYKTFGPQVRKRTFLLTKDNIKKNQGCLAISYCSFLSEWRFLSYYTQWTILKVYEMHTMTIARTIVPLFLNPSLSVNCNLSSNHFHWKFHTNFQTHPYYTEDAHITITSAVLQPTLLRQASASRRILFSWRQNKYIFARIPEHSSGGSEILLQPQHQGFFIKMSGKPFKCK